MNITTNENIYLNTGNDNIIFRCGQQEKVFPLNSKLKTSAVSQNSYQIISEHVKQLLAITEIRTRKQIIELPNLSGKRAVIDLCSIRPSLIVDKDKEINLPFRLLVQLYATNEGEQLLDCKNSAAVMLQKNNTTIGMSELFLNKTEVPIAEKSLAAKLFCQTLREHIKTESLTYLLPDCIDDFEIETLRKSINFYFRDTEPLPRSIAVVLAWQASTKFKQYRIKKEYIILVT